MTTDRLTRNPCAGGLVGAVLVLLAMAGCSLDGPVAEDHQTVSLRLEAPLPTGGLDKGEPPTLAEMLQRPDRMSAAVVIDRLDAGGRAVARVGEGTLGDITVDVEQSLLRFQGVVDVEPGQLIGSRYRLNLELSYRGEQVSGEYRGEFDLQSGIIVAADTLRIGELVRLDDQRQATRSFGLCLSTPAIAGDPVCVTGDDLDGDGLVYEPATDLVTFNYRRTGVVWEGSDLPRTIIVEFRGGLRATSIMAGSREIGPLIPGRLEPVEVDIHLVPTIDDMSGPGWPGEVLAGDLELRFEDGLPPQETGRAILVRTVAASARP
jgi:hypothetical protein